MAELYDDQSDVTPNWLAGMPAFSVAAPPKNTGIFGPALASGFHEALGNLGSTAQAVGTLTGISPVADWGKGFAQRQAAAATAAGNPELEQEGFGSFKGALYGLTKALPTLVPTIAADVAAGPVGAGLSMLPSAIGGNVQAAEQAHSDQALTVGDAAKSLLLGAPEAAAMSFVPGKLGEFLMKGAAGNFGERVIGGGLKLGAYQGLLGGVQTAVTQQAFTPDMPVADRARQVVDSALSGGIQGAVFGGLFSLRKAQAPAKTGDPAKVSNDDLTAATDAVVQPQQAQPAQIPPPEHMTPLTKTVGRPYGDTPNDQLQAMAQPLATKGADRSADENVQHGLIQEEIAARTPPGLAPGEGTPFTPGEMAQRQPGVDATRALAAKAAGGENDFTRNLNASNEAELVNSIRTQADAYAKSKNVPGYFKTLAEKYGIPIGDKGSTPAEQLVDLQDQLAKSQAARDAAQVSGKTALMRAANKEITDLVPQITAAEKLAQTHLEADKIKSSYLPPIEDPTGQLNLLGLGERPVVPTNEGQTVEGGPTVPTTDGQLGMDLGLSPEKLDQMSKFQDLALSAFKGRAREQVEPIVRGSGASSEPELINALRDQHQALDGGAPDNALGKLLEHYGVADRLGSPLDLADERRGLMEKYQDQLDKASAEQKAGKAGQADITFNKAQQFRNTMIKAHDDLVHSHSLADDLRNPEVAPEVQAPEVQVPETVAPQLADRWRLAETMRSNANDPATIKAAEMAQRAIEQNNPHSQAILQLAQNKFSDEMRSKVTSQRGGAKPAEGSTPLDDRVAAAVSGGDVVSINDLKAKLGDVSDQDLGTSLARLEKADRVQGMEHDLPSMAQDAGVVKRPNGTDINAVMARVPAPATQPVTPDEFAAQRAAARPRSIERVKLPTEEQTAKIRTLEPNLTEPASADKAQRDGAAARRAGTSRAENPFDKAVDPDGWAGWRKGWELANTSRFAVDSGRVLPDLSPKKEPPQKIDPVRAEEKLTAAVKDGQLSPEKLAQAKQVLAMPRGYAKDIRMKDLANSWAAIEAHYGRPFNQSISRLNEPPQLATVDDPSKSWAKVAADNIFGDVIAADDRIALVKGYNSLGRPIYLPVDRNLGLRGTSDVRTSQNSWLQASDAAKFRQIAALEEKADGKAYAENPDGPFKDATDRVIGSAGTDPKMVGYIGKLLRSVGIDARVLVTNPADVRGAAGDALGLHGPFQQARIVGRQDVFGEMTSMGPGMKDFVISIDPSHPIDIQIETAAHEVGHIVYDTALRNAPPDVREKIERAYNAFYRQTTGATAQDIIKMTRNRATSKHLLDNMAPESTLNQEGDHYFRSKSEWFADQVSRWATTAAEPRTVLDKFFHGVAQKIKELISTITGQKFFPDFMVQRFMDRLVQSSDLRDLGQPLRGEHIPITPDTGPTTPAEVDTTAHQAVASISDVKDYLSDKLWSEPRAGAGAAARRAALGWETLDGIVRIGQKFLSTAAGWRDFHTNRALYGDAKDKAHSISSKQFLVLKPEVRAQANELLAMMNDGSGLDPRKALADHAGVVVTPEIAARHAEMVSKLAALRQAGGRPGMEAILQMNQTLKYQSLAARMYREGVTWMQKGGAPFEGHMMENPDKVYRGMTGMAGHDSPDATNLYYKNTVRAMRDGIAKHIGDADLAAASRVAGATAGGLDNLRANLKQWNDEMAQADKGTYVPITRGTGKYFVSGKIAVDNSKAPKPEAVQALQAAIEKEFPNIGIFHDSDSNTIMSRVESMAQAERLKVLYKGLEDAGHMLPGETKAGYPDRIDTMAGLGPKYMQQMVAAADEMIANTDIKDDKVANQLKQQMVEKWMDMLPDNSVLKNMQPRKNISGFAKDLGENAIRLARSQTRASTSIGMQPEWARASAAIRDEVQAAKAGKLQDSVKTQDIANELWLREAQQAWQQPHSPFDTMQMGMHMLRIGFSPPYILTMMSQIPTLSLPELSKKWGYAKSSLALARAAPRAFKAMRAMLSDPDWAKAGMRETTFLKAGISKADTATLLKLDNMGGGSNNSYTSLQTSLGEGAHEGLHKFRDMANAMGLYAEMFPRIITALAAGDLHDAQPVKGISREQSVYDMVNSSQFNWGAGQSSRMTGSKGPFGQASRVIFQFTSFQTRMIEKLYTEAKGLFDKDPALRAESASFLAGHLVSMVAIAGTLGLPLMGALAGVADKLIMAWTGKDDVDTQGIYRTFLAKMMGPGMADVLAKGLPRGMGIDLSHLGEQNILPFTGLLQNKRKVEDAMQDFTRGLAGSAVGEATNMYLGARDMVNGDYLRGSIKVLPEGFKGLAEGYFFYKNGYVDKNGTKYPVQPGAMNILTAALGLDPANLAQYDEALHIRSGLMAERQYRAQNITMHLQRAFNNPDSADMHYWINEAMQYQLDHPGMSGPLTRIQQTLQSMVRKSATARALNVPIGVSYMDRGIMGSLGFIAPQKQ